MLIFDIVEPADLVGYIRGLAYEQNLNVFQLSAFLPQKDIMDTEFRITRGNLLDEDAATYRNFDTESPIANRKGHTRITGQIPPISRKISLGEEERLKLNQLRGGDESEVINAIYDDAGKMTRSLLSRFELARGEALFNGTLNLNENGVAGLVDYGRQGAMTVTAGTLWSDLANSDPISDLLAWMQVYLNINGILPAYTLLSSFVIANLMRNAKLRVLASTVAGSPGIVSVATLNAIFATFGIPPLVPYDSRVRVAGVATRVTPNNKILFLPPDNEPLGNLMTGITAEALELVSGGYITTEQAPGIVGVVEKTWDPVRTWTKACSIALPVIANPDLTMVATVQ